MIEGRVDIITMGCSKNLVDSEALARMVQRRGYSCRHDPRVPAGEYVVVNTCGFIQDAKQESIDTILRLAEMKKHGKIGKIIVMGCLSQRYLAQLEKAIPEADRYYGKFDFADFAAALPDLRPACSMPRKARSWRATPRHYAYVKISEGCNRRCAFCAIPVITGRQKSRPETDILAEVRELAAQGVKELQIVAQELTGYGIDLDGTRRIAGLVDEISRVKGIEWIRLHYAYPSRFPAELLDVMRERPNVCKYLDIAFQHVNDRILKAMRRNFTRRETLELISLIRERVPGIFLRTTLMTGFPGETDAEFDELLSFVREVRFERMGAFAYSHEEGTFAAKNYADDIPEEVKRNRLSRLMALQQKIAAETESRLVGQTLRVIIDRREGEWFVGRTQFSSPEVDPEVLVKASKQLRCGRFYNVRMTDCEAFDLYGEAVV